MASKWILCPGIALSVFVLGLSQLPWWVLIVPAMIAGIFYFSGKRAFLEAFVAAFLVWALVAFAQDTFAGFRLSERVAGLFHLPFGSLAYIVTGLVAGLTAGAAAWVGQLLRSFTYPVVSTPAD